MTDAIRERNETRKAEMPYLAKAGYEAARQSQIADIDTLLAENERLRAALRAEREQCAAIARRFPETWKGHGEYTVHAVSTAIAKAIEEQGDG